MGQLYPFTDPLSGAAPRVIVSGEGCWVTDETGGRFLDAVAGLWCTALGWGNEELVEAASDQMRRLAFYHSFKGRASEPTERLARTLVPMLPGDLTHVFFGTSGSDAVETAVKIAHFYQNARGKPEKKRIVARVGAYHGSGAVSFGLTGMDYVHGGFDQPAGLVLRTGRPHHHAEGRPNESEAQFARRLADELDAQIAAAGPDTVCAMIGEPIMGAGGVIVPPEGYWGAVQEVLRAHDVLLIADEVITGFGRTGRMFASELYGIRPDLMTMAKQLTSAYLPLSATAVSRDIHEVLAESAHGMGIFGHGFTYGGHPVSCAVALKAIEIYHRMDLPSHVTRLGEHLASRLDGLKGRPGVGNVRSVGLIGAVELTPGLAARAGAEAEARGVFFRIVDDSVCFSPPLVVTEDEIDHIVAVLGDSVAAVVGEAA